MKKYFCVTQNGKIRCVNVCRCDFPSQNSIENKLKRKRNEAKRTNVTEKKNGIFNATMATTVWFWLLRSILLCSWHFAIESNCVFFYASIRLSSVPQNNGGHIWRMRETAVVVYSKWWRVLTTIILLFFVNWTVKHCMRDFQTLNSVNWSIGFVPRIFR